MLSHNKHINNYAQELGQVMSVMPTRWVEGPTLLHSSVPSNSRKSEEPGAANRIPPEIAGQISGYLDVKDLARAAMAWRPVALASYASPETIKLECARYSLLTNGPQSTWSSGTVRAVRDRMEQYNFAWTTLQFSGSKSFNIPGTSPDTMWAGSKNWRSGSHFMGESNGYMYEVSTWKTSGVQAKLRLYQLPSLRTGGTDLKKVEFNVNLRTDSLKAVTVDPVAKVVALLELSALHVYGFHGRYLGPVSLLALFRPSAEIYHMELHGEMACIVSHYPSSNSLIGIASDVLIQSWVGEQRSMRMDFFWGTHCMNYCTGFQFITEDLWIATEKGRTHPCDTIPTHFIRVGHVRLNKQIVVDLKDSLGNQYWTPNNISLIRNLSHYAPVSGPFSTDPARRLFGIKYEYRDFDGSLKANCALFGRATVEAWLGLGGPPDHMHWLMMPFPSIKSMHVDLTNREGLYLVGRRLVWATIWEHGWSLNVIDYNPGVGNAIPNTVELRGETWKSWTGLWCSDPYPVALSSSTRIANITRVVPTEDGILLKTNDLDANYTMLLM